MRRRIVSLLHLIFIVFSLSAICYTLYANEDSITATASFDKAEITIGEKVKYTVIIEAPKDTKIEFPVIDSMLTGAGFTIRDFGEEKPVKISKDKSRIKHWYILDTYITGSYNVPAVVINYILPDGAKSSVETKDVFLEVKSVIKEGEQAEDICDIKMPVDIKVSYKKIVIWSLIIVLLIGAGIGIYLYLNYRRYAMETVKLIPLYVIALKDLEALKNMRLDTEDMVKQYYIRVSGIVRHYIEKRFNLNAPEMTTEEFLNEMASPLRQGEDEASKEVLYKEHKILLKDFLRHCDMVKFAKYGPTKDEIDGVYITAKRFVEETIPKNDVYTKPRRHEDTKKNEEERKKDGIYRINRI